MPVCNGELCSSPADSYVGMFLEGEECPACKVERERMEADPDYRPASQRAQDYDYVYTNWYCKSCERSNETPVPFSVYYRRMPYDQMMMLKQWLDEGRTPQ
ncbi:hypothetical protein SP15_228 [Bacillus phage SP-15]|uniref:Uncharacterized protein n=1 Tax=Bacillus phage SP-15 TaxID=1792032 RepID=A0A127AWP5_9CAUD|nr:hypothetical protein SP15_228 [Bacillus phage SP-15]AMM45030.1 hypothetical protein SP15_228 [Bacillus phage SP-15]